MKIDSFTEPLILQKAIQDSQEMRKQRHEYKAKARKKKVRSRKSVKNQYKQRCKKRKMELEKINKAIQQGGEGTEKLIAFAELLKLPPINLDNAKEIADRSVDYLNICAKNDIKPGVEGMCLALGVSRKTYNYILNGTVQKEKEVVATFKQIHQFLTAEMEYYMLHGKINPASAIFILKNNFGYKDQVETVITKDEQEKVDADKIREKYMLNG